MRILNGPTGRTSRISIFDEPYTSNRVFDISPVRLTALPHQPDIMSDSWTTHRTRSTPRCDLRGAQASGLRLRTSKHDFNFRVVRRASVSAEGNHPRRDLRAHNLYEPFELRYLPDTGRKNPCAKKCPGNLTHRSRPLERRTALLTYSESEDLLKPLRRNTARPCPISCLLNHHAAPPRQPWELVGNSRISQVTWTPP